MFIIVIFILSFLLVGVRYKREGYQATKETSTTVSSTYTKSNYYNNKTNKYYRQYIYDVIHIDKTIKNIFDAFNGGYLSQ